MIAHTHVLQGDSDGCPACATIRPESQVHPSLVPPLPAGPPVPGVWIGRELGDGRLIPEPDDDPSTPAHVEALAEATHRIRDERPVCDGGIESKCHWWPDPTECDHEAFPCGHEYVFHDDCWIIQWLEATDLGDTCDDTAFDLRIDDGDAGRWPNGVIDWEWEGDYVTWSYASVDPVPEGEPVPAALPDGRRESDVPLWEEVSEA